MTIRSFGEIAKTGVFIAQLAYEPGEDMFYSPFLVVETGTTDAATNESVLVKVAAVPWIDVAEYSSEAERLNGCAVYLGTVRSIPGVVDAKLADFFAVD
jgi:hypothetical protein